MQVAAARAGEKKAQPAPDAERDSYQLDEVWVRARRKQNVRFLQEAVITLGAARALAREDTSAPIRDAEHAAGNAPTGALVEYVIGALGIFLR